MNYEFNKADILNRIEEVENEKAYWINYNVPQQLDEEDYYIVSISW